MKLIRYGESGKEKIGVQIDSVNYDVAAFGGDYNEQFFAENGLARLEQFVKANEGKLVEIPAGSRLGSPFARPSKIVCIGLNYKDHAAETGAAIPAEPIIFMKSTTALVGPNDQVVIPKNSVKTDWEVEFGIVIGQKATYVEESEALDYVAGYVLHNDVSEREFQIERGGTWDKGKGCDTFAPMGPVMTTKEEIPDINNVRLWLKVNGKTYQDGNTKNLIFSVKHVVSYVSQFMTLLPGDVISTGTPAGVGLGFNPPIYLKEGDVIELGADYLGEQRQEVSAWRK
ncbi:2-keto-4-pentenoate hydratase/2-oxohepta-3-ene-1,7-dioic acid hydratase (catechol pathway) [Sphingobacterium nematocida]|uniref:2-keto-4-pentenoate hydratase/2-oxohepta-3-ene-1,7-dioic acid hydratase (Catechol pathway) n=1 Tax=Sphingobacterium nematocida TaxID=1513896 RepID=A0A1T5CI36_9SPHI|nr:fumarylacetoacetate hydrolase family protein [Sphingobacterium nematocida]SKB59152.1 2-keto-4-pentenoate hydratase/2-oxohepta-3-ene-1,7-dioic acid hydratase (catechol pathway) [Sphingobacterium nematocida]